MPGEKNHGELARNIQTGTSRFEAVFSTKNLITAVANIVNFLVDGVAPLSSGFASSTV